MTTLHTVSDNQAYKKSTRKEIPRCSTSFRCYKVNVSTYMIAELKAFQYTHIHHLDIEKEE